MLEVDLLNWIADLENEQAILKAQLAASQERERILKVDQADWRKGVALIASSLGDPGDNLSCARLAEVALTIRGELESAQERERILTEALNKGTIYLTPLLF